MIAQRSTVRLLSSTMVLAAVAWLGTGGVMAEPPMPEDALVPVSAMEDILPLRIGFDGSDYVFFTNVVFGIRDGELVIAQRDRHCGGDDIRFADYSADLDYIVEDTSRLPRPVTVVMGGYAFEVDGFTLAQTEEGNTIVYSLKGRSAKGLPFEWTLEGEGRNRSRCNVAVLGTCNDFWCTSTCSMDLADCDRCDCDGTGFCTDGSTRWACQDVDCAPDICEFDEDECNCPCRPPTSVGACCLGIEGCVETTLAECVAMEGDFMGEGTTCDTVECPGPEFTGACCLVQGIEHICAEMRADECAELNGTYLGDGALCLGDNNNNGIDDACEAGIPAVSEWGLIAMTLLLLTAGAIVLGRRRQPAA